MADSPANLGHQYTAPINPPITNTKTPIISTNNALPNVPHRRKSRKTKPNRKHSSSQSNPSLLSTYDHCHDTSHLPDYPAYDPLWEPVAIIANRYAMGPKIGSGSFGSVHAGVDLKDNYRYVAIKLEPIEPNHHPQLKREYEIYGEIDALSASYTQHTHPMGYNHKPSKIRKDLIGIPKIFYFGLVEGHPFNALVMEMLGPSLEKLFNICHRKFSLKTVLMIADQMLSRLEFIHDTGYLHRDLKPDNFLMGMYNSERVVYVVDMGLGKRYMNSNGRHIPYVEGKTLTGTARYASVNTHLGVEQSRRDDLESLGYIFMYFLRGRLPWQGIKAKTRHEKYEKIARKKLSTLPEQLCKGYPEEFAHLIRYSWRLGYEERPNYEELRRRFREVFFKLGYTADWQYDWDLKGMGATKLALENHPFVRGNVPGDRKSKKRRKEREMEKLKQANNATDKDDIKCDWGGDKHHEHKTKRSSKHRTKPNVVQVSPKPMISRPRHSLPILTKDTKNTNNNSSKQHSGCLQQVQPECTTPSKRQKQNKRWNFACFQSQTPKPPPNVRNTEKLLPNRRQSAQIHRKQTKTNRVSESNPTHKDHQKIANEHVAISPTCPRQKRLSQPIYQTRKLPKHQYLQHSQAYSPAGMRGHNISSSPMTYTPSYSHQSSSPSPIHHRRYSDHYAAKPILSNANMNHGHHSMSGGYIISAPANNAAPLRLQRSQSHRVSPPQHGRRSVILNSHNTKHNTKQNNHKPVMHKSSAELYDEWVKSQQQPPCYAHPAAPYNMNVSMTPTRYHAAYQQYPQQQQYTISPSLQRHAQAQAQHKYIDRNDLIEYRHKYQIPSHSCSPHNPQQRLHSLDNYSPIPIQNEMKNTIANTSTLPLKTGLIKVSTQQSPQSLKSPLHSHVKSPLSAKHSPRSNRSNKSNKSNKSHRSSRNNTANERQKDRFSLNSKHNCSPSTSNSHKKSPKSRSKSSNSPILDETQHRKNLKSPHSNHDRLLRNNSLNPLIRSSSRHSHQSHSISKSNQNITSSSGSMLVNAASLWNELIVPNKACEQVVPTDHHCVASKSRMSVICDGEEFEKDEEEEDDTFKMLETQFTGRSLTRTTHTKEEKERHNSGSTSKGLLTERDFSSHTETINTNRIQTTPRSYSVNNNKGPFVKNSSNSSTHPIIEEDIISLSLNQ